MGIDLCTACGAFVCVCSNKKIAIGASNTFIAIVTPAAGVALSYGTVVGFRPADALGVFAWVLGSNGPCAGKNCNLASDRLWYSPADRECTYNAADNRELNKQSPRGDCLLVRVL